MQPIEIITGPKEREKFTANTFLQYMRKSAPHWWTANDTSSECGWVFRGHRDANWKLVPSAGREQYREDEPFRRILENLGRQITAKDPRWQECAPNDRGIALRLWAHVLSIGKFMKLGQDLNFKVSQPPSIQFDFKDKISEILDYQLKTDKGFPLHFRGDIYFSILNGNGPFNFETGFNFLANTSIALAQHHGVPTFLLDWTENPSTACFFATSNADKNVKDSDLAVWALNAKLAESNTLKTIFELLSPISKVEILRPPKSDNQYLSSQSGVFASLHPLDVDWGQSIFPSLDTVIQRLAVTNLRQTYMERKDAGHPFIPNGIEQCIENFESQNEPLLRKVILPADQRLELQKLLLREGITKAHMMPSLDNVAKTSLNNLANELED